MVLNDVLEESSRLQWGCVPFKSVGPVRFGMSCTEVETAIGEDLSFWATRLLHGGVTGRTLTLPGQRRGRPAVDVYFTDDDRVFCLAINGRCGPQVTLGGVRLVGRVPSELETEFSAYAAAQDAGPRYSVSNDLAAEAFGVVLCSQRAADVVVSRPVFVGHAWSHMFWDNSESCIPSVEWPQIYF